jgi:hypothetical protein
LRQRSAPALQLIDGELITGLDPLAPEQVRATAGSAPRAARAGAAGDTSTAAVIAGVAVIILLLGTGAGVELRGLASAAG